MTTRFQVTVLEFSVLTELADEWGAADYVALLDRMEYGDTTGMSDSDLREMCLLSLQEREPALAAALVLEHDLGSGLRKGQIIQLGHRMCEEKLWEEYPDMALHEQLFHTASLLYAAFPRDVPEPDAVRVSLEVEAGNAEAREILSQPLDESFVVRLIADGMPANAVLHRLFADQLSGSSFPEARSIVWTVQAETLAEGRLKLEVLSSGYWLDALREAGTYASTAYPDDVPDEAEDAGVSPDTA